MRSIEYRYFQLTCVTHNHPKPPHFPTFCNAFHISVTGEVRHLNLVGRFIVECSSPSVTKRPRKGRGQGHMSDDVTNFKMLHAHISRMAKASRQILCVYSLYMKWAWSGSCDQVPNFTVHEISSKRLNHRLQILCTVGLREVL